MRFSSKCGLQLDVRALLQSQPAHATIEIGSIGLEDAGGFGHVALGLGQRGADEAPFVLIERIIEGPAELNRRGIRRWWGRRGAAQHLPYRRCIDNGTAQNAQPLDQIGQLADVARPGVGGEGIERGVGETQACGTGACSASGQRLSRLYIWDRVM